MLGAIIGDLAGSIDEYSEFKDSLNSVLFKLSLTYIIKYTLMKLFCPKPGYFQCYSRLICKN